LIAAWHDDASVTSHSIASEPGPASSAASASRSPRRASSATVAPLFASPMAIDRPSPLDAPTTTVLMRLERSAFSESEICPLRDGTLAAVARNEQAPTWREMAVARSLDSARTRAENRVQRFLDAALDLMNE